MSRSFFAKLNQRFGQKPSGKHRHIRSEKKRQQFLESVRQFVPSGAQSHAGIKPVIIIGAGMAGMSAAYWLHRHGVPVTVLEAMPDRIGGRVHSLHNFPEGRITEAGGELIGTNHPLWLEMAREHGLGLGSLSSEDEFSAAGLNLPLVLGGKTLTPAEAEFLYNEMNAVFQAMSEEAMAIADAYKPWEYPEAEKYDRMSIADKLEALQVMPGTLLYEAIEVQLVNNNVAPLREQSYLGLLALIKGGSFADDPMAFFTESEIYHCNNGNDSLPYAINDLLPVGALLGKAVNSIRIHENEVNITTADGDAYAADYAILTAAGTAWHHIDFDPALPPEYYMQYGSAVKYLSPVTNRFWIRTDAAPSSMSDQLGMTWEGTDNQTLMPGQQLEFSVFAGGMYADRIMNPPPPFPDPTAYLEKGIAGMYPNYNEYVAAPGLLMEWPKIKYIETGYSIPVKGQVCTTAKKLNMAYPADTGYPGRLYFAGEQICMAYFGYMEGGLQSGFISAMRVLRALGVVKKNA